MTVKRGLGRGLATLLGDISTADVTSVSPRGFRHIALAQITPNPHQPRTTFDAAALDDLRASIAEFGVLVPIIVRPAHHGYELIAGERRWRAARAAGLDTIPAIVRQADERESLEVAIIENLQRENLDPLEEAMGFAHLIDTYGFTQERVAERLGRSRSSVANSLRLLTLSDSIKTRIRNGSISAGHARALLSLPPDRRDAVAHQIVSGSGMTVRMVEEVARRAQKAPALPGRAASRVLGDREELLERLRYRLGARVTVVSRGTGGALEVRFSDESDLLRLVDLLLGDATGP